MIKRTTTLFLLLAWAIAPSAAWADSVRLLDRAAAPGPEVHLREVAALDGPEAAKLGELVVAQMGPQDREASLTLEALREQLTNKGVNWGRLSLGGFPRCRVEAPSSPTAPATSTPAFAGAAVANPGSEVSLDTALTVRERLLDVLATLAAADRADLKVRFADSDARVLGLSTLADRFEFEPQSATGLGRVPVVVRRWSGDKLVETTRVTADVSRRCLALVTTRAIGRGQTLAPSDVEVQEVYLEAVRTGVITDPARVVGQNTAAAMRKGAVVYPDSLRSPTVVHRGDTMTVRCVSGGMVIKTAARAAEDGAVDQVIQARNERSRAAFLVKITGPLEGLLVHDDDAPDKKSDGGDRR